MDKNYDVISFISNYPILRRPGVAIFADIIKVVTTFSKSIIKDARKVKKIRSYVSKSNLYLFFLMHQNLLISSEKIPMSAELRDVSCD